MDNNSAQTPELRIDRIVYLASLVSNRYEIDKHLDALREMTARSGKNGTLALTAKDEAVLAQLESYLKDYLVHKEPFRNFTAESLEQKVYERVQASVLIRRLRWITAYIFILAFILAGSVILLPFKGASLPQVSIIVFMTTLYLGGLYLFYSSLKQFSVALREAFHLLCTAFLCGSVGILSNAVLTIIYDGNAPWNIFWITNLGYVVSYALLYMGSRKLAALQNVHSRLANPWLVVAVAIICATALALTPGGRYIPPLNGMTSWLSAINVVFTFPTFWLLGRVWFASTDQYRVPFRGMCLGLLGAVCGWAVFTIRPFFPDEQGLLLRYVADMFSTIAILVLLWAAYSFNKLSRR